MANTPDIGSPDWRYWVIEQLDNIVRGEITDIDLSIIIGRNGSETRQAINELISERDAALTLALAQAIDASSQAAITESKRFAATRDQATLDLANKYTDEHAGSGGSDVTKTYVDAGDTATLNVAVRSAEAGDASVATSLREYADEAARLAGVDALSKAATADEKVLRDAKAYTDAHAGSGGGGGVTEEQLDNAVAQGVEDAGTAAALADQVVAQEAADALTQGLANADLVLREYADQTANEAATVVRGEAQGFATTAKTEGIEYTNESIDELATNLSLVVDTKIANVFSESTEPPTIAFTGYNGGGYSIPPSSQSAWNTIPFTPQIDTRSAWNDANEEYLIQEDGTYVVTASVRIADTIPVGSNFAIGIAGSNGDSELTYWYTVNGLRSTFVYTRQTYFAAGTNVRVFMYNELSSAVPIQNASFGLSRPALPLNESSGDVDKNYVDTATFNAVRTANGYSDSADVAVLNSAKSYSDSKAKPGTGWVLADFAQPVRSSISKADTALQPNTNNWIDVNPVDTAWTTSSKLKVKLLSATQTVKLRSVLQRDTTIPSGTTIAKIVTLPEGHRPIENASFIVPGGGGAWAQITISINGELDIKMYGASSFYVRLDGIEFSVV